jgi:pyruvate ferredoxin oxidoreductase beta subunit
VKVKREYYKSTKDLPADEFLSGGSPLCAGCGGLTTLRLVHKVLGGNVVIVNAAGCLTLVASYPYTPLRSSWLYTTMGGPSAAAQGIRDAVDVLRSQGRLAEGDDLKVLVLAGDGSSYEMGLSATSAAIHRNLDFWYLCYDNEAYGNTGFQTSAASALTSQTATSPEGVTRTKKDLFEIWRAQRPPYLATISSHEPVDLAEKVRRSMTVTGPKMFIALAVCPPGWGFDPELSEEIAHRAVQTGVWPLKEAVAGVVRHTYIPDRLHPVEEYLEPQRRFRHLFHPQRRDDLIGAIQAPVDAYWQHVRESELGQGGQTKRT